MKLSKKQAISLVVIGTGFLMSFYWLLPFLASIAIVAIWLKEE